MSALTERDLELIEVALESAIAATSFSLGGRDDTVSLCAEYRTALRHVREVTGRDEAGVAR